MSPRQDASKLTGMQFVSGAGGRPDAEWVRRMNPPENEIPVALPQNTVLARTPDVAVALLGLQVCSLGLAFELAIRLRPTATELPDLQETFWGLRRRREPHTGQFLVGVELADGSRATNIGSPRQDGDVVFHESGGGGGSHSIQQSWWLSPLPPDGPVRLIVRCDSLGIPETTTDLDGTAIRRAAADVVTLWPWEPPAFEEPPELPPPAVPADSWFAG